MNMPAPTEGMGFDDSGRFQRGTSGSAGSSREINPWLLTVAWALCGLHAAAAMYGFYQGGAFVLPAWFGVVMVACFAAIRFGLSGWRR